MPPPSPTPRARTKPGWLRLPWSLPWICCACRDAHPDQAGEAELGASNHGGIGWRLPQGAATAGAAVAAVGVGRAAVTAEETVGVGQPDGIGETPGDDGGMAVGDVAA